MSYMVESELLCGLIRILSAGLSWAEMVVSAKMSFPGFKGIASVLMALTRLMRRCWGKEEGEDVGALGGEEFALVEVDVGSTLSGGWDGICFDG